MGGMGGNNLMDASCLISLAESQGLELVLNGSDVQVFGPREAIKNLRPVLIGNKPNIVALLAARKASMPMERIELTKDDNARIQWLTGMLAEVHEDATAHAGQCCAPGHATPRRWCMRTKQMLDGVRFPWWPIRSTVLRLANLLSEGTGEQKRKSLLELAEFHAAFADPKSSWRSDNYDREEWPIVTPSI